jgi:tRNA modification GTPase
VIQPATTFTRLTSAAPAAIAVIEVVGPESERIVQSCWRPNQGSSELLLNRTRFGYSQNEQSTVGESIVVCKTGEQRIELHCHGGSMAAEQIIDEFIRHGAIEQSLSDRIAAAVVDEIAQEAIEDLGKAVTLRSTSILLDQMRGSLRKEFDQVEALVTKRCFSEAIGMLNSLKERYKYGSHLVKPWRVVLAGPPNAGKSSLLNRLLGYTRAIVHEQAGTTRDLLAERSSLEGWPIELIDSAGIRSHDQASDDIELTGIERTLESLAMADCTLLLTDPVSGWTATHADVLKRSSGSVILVLTKVDLVSQPARWEKDSFVARIKEADSALRIGSVVETSSLTGEGLPSLMDAIVAILVPSDVNPGVGVPFRERHLSWIEKRLNALSSNV